MTQTLRPYQRVAVEAMHEPGSTLMVLPTGAGKTSVMSEGLTTRREDLALVLAHRAELVDQAAQRLSQWDLKPGVVRGAADPWGSDLIVSTVQAIHNRQADLARWCRGRNLRVVVDEAHRIKGGTYEHVLGLLKRTAATVNITGLTATPYRLDNKPMGETFDRLVEPVTVSYLFDHGQCCGGEWPFPGPCGACGVPLRSGYLMEPELYEGVAIDTRGIKTTAGDFAQDELAKRAVKIVADVATEYKKWADGRQFIAFAAGVDHAEALAKEMGPDVAVLVGSTPAEQRDRILAMLAIGRIRGVVNVAVLIEGWDPESDHKRALKLFRGDPEYVPVSVAIDCRPTQSLCLYMQGPMGRNMRTHPRKDRALYLGHAGNTARHKGMPRAHEGFSLTRAMDAARTRVAIPQAPTAQIMVCGRCLTVQEPPMCLRCKIPLAGAPLRRVEQVAGELRRVGGGEVVVDVTAMVAFLASFRRLGLNRDAAAARWQQQHGRAPDGAAWVKACEQAGMR